MVEDVIKFRKRHLEGRGMLECVCVCRVYLGFEGGGGGEAGVWG